MQSVNKNETIARLWLEHLKTFRSILENVWEFWRISISLVNFYKTSNLLSYRFLLNDGGSVIFMQ